MSTTLSPPPPPPSAEIIGHNEDLLTQLLTHLPFTHLLHFKLISKQWNSLISNPHFSLLHSLRHPHHPSSAIFFLHHHLSLSSTYHFIPFSNYHHYPPFLNLLNSHRFDILQSCNGLLLCVSGGTVYVFNPSINHNDGVFSVGEDNGVGSFNLGFDPLVSPHFSVVRVKTEDDYDNNENLSRMNNNLYSIDVYCSSTKRWRNNVVGKFTCPFDIEFDHGVYWEGRVHWLSHTEKTVYFDLNKGCVETMMLPKAIEGSYIERFRYFGESCGHLHLIEIRTNCVSGFDVLELSKDNKVEWFVKYRVNLDVLGRGFEAELFQDHSDRFGRGFRFYAFSVLAVVRGKVGDDHNREDKDEDDSELILSIPGKVISYNFRTRVSRLLSNVVDESDKLFPFRGHNAFQFIQSLYCVS